MKEHQEAGETRMGVSQKCLRHAGQSPSYIYRYGMNIIYEKGFHEEGQVLIYISND